MPPLVVVDDEALRFHRGALRADGAVVLTPTATGISRVIKFHEPALVATFGLLLVILGVVRSGRIADGLGLVAR